jgi:hypothetical protein
MSAQSLFNLLISIPNREKYTKDDIRKIYTSYLKIIETKKKLNMSLSNTPKSIQNDTSEFKDDTKDLQDNTSKSIQNNITDLQDNTSKSIENETTDLQDNISKPIENDTKDLEYNTAKSIQNDTKDLEDNTAKSIKDDIKILDAITPTSIDDDLDNLINNIDNLTINEVKKNVIDNKQMSIDIFKILEKNNYINEKTKVNESIHSFSYLATRKDLGQSQKISLGICMEKLLHDMISTCNDWKNIKPKNEKGKKEKDSLWLNEKLKKIIYAEYKANLELDTEKSKETDRKCKNISDELKLQYSDYNLTCVIVGLRYLSSKEKIIEPILKKYTDTPIYGINDYLTEFNIKSFDNYDEYKKVIDKIIELKYD